MKKTILIIDDSLFYRKIFDVVLKSSGYNVITFEGGAEAEKFLLKGGGTVDLILVDLMMPEVSGFNFLEWLHKTFGDSAPRVFAMTGEYPLQEVLDKVRKMHAAGLINKTLPVDQILFRINQILYGDERDSGRRHARVGVVTLVNFLLEGVFDQGNLSNISISGALVLTSLQGKPGDNMSLEFILPGIPELIVVHATVVRVVDQRVGFGKDRLTGLGIEFSEVGIRARKGLTSFVEKRIREDLAFAADSPSL